jgi:hypothetical protein
MTELSGLLSVNAGLHVTCIPLMVSSSSPFIRVHSLHFHLQYESLEIDTYLNTGIHRYTYFCPVFGPGGCKGKKSKSGKNYTLIFPRR